MVSLLQILVVEDSLESRELLLEMIAILGHTAHGAGTAEEALEILARQPIDVLLTDINLPGMSGLDLAKIALQTLPQLQVIFASGYGFLVIDNDRIDFNFILLSKPYSLTQVEDALLHITDIVASYNRSSAS